MVHSPENPRSRYWDRALEGGLPDCRLTGTARRRTTMVRGRMVWEQVFCANCGALHGLVTAEWTAHVFYLCDECARANGPPPGCIEVEAPPGTVETAGPGLRQA